ncbi:LysE family translocator [Shewanella corallii]|uniref:LysE family translocator n=1 Tax=Shewanella corallii TaxID=560080 RepID=A0ABT0NAQ3_9GAMM|nr:LysE family translocator [Shewanella corallii]MCL2915537.1 LysE family translocator [Shewanella corallii]
MDINTIMTFTVVATLLVISPGPNGFLIAKTVPVSGNKAGFANVFGFVAAFYIHGTLSVCGISILLLQSANAFFVFKMLGAAYLIWIGIKALIKAFGTSTPAQVQAEAQANVQGATSLKTAFMEGFLTNVLNPKVSMFYLAAFPQFVSADDSALAAYTLVTTHALVNFVWFGAMVLALSQAKQLATSGRFKKWLDVTTGTIFIGFGTKLALMRNA